MDPADLRPYLSHLMLLDIEGPDFRYRLVGTQVVADLGRDPTSTVFGTHVTAYGYAAALVGQLCQVRDQADALFTTGRYRTPEGNVHSTARLLLPLGEDHDVRMIIQARAARFPRNRERKLDWLACAEGAILDTKEVRKEVELEQPVADWFTARVEVQPVCPPRRGVVTELSPHRFAGPAQPI